MQQPIERIEVRLLLREQPIKVGELVLFDRQIYFKYTTDFLEEGLNISPFKLALTAEIQRPNTEVLDGLFGVFYDSLPDGWGRLLQDRSWGKQKGSLVGITALDRLAMVGDRGMGALTYHPILSDTLEWDDFLALDGLAIAATEILAGESSSLLDQLTDLGGSSGGARPKILVGFNPKTEQLLSPGRALSADFEHWLVKFKASTDLPDAANIEFAYYKMALAAGLEMSDCRLLTADSGRQFFATKRFDRVGNDRLHLHSAAGMLHDNFRLSALDYGHVMDAAFRLEERVGAYRKVLRLAAFNVFAHNRDDHSKNVAFLMDAKGGWRLAPAYDLTFSNSGHGQHSMTVAGEGSQPGITDLMRLATTFNIKKPRAILDETREAIRQWPKIAQDCGVSQASRREIGRVLKI